MPAVFPTRLPTAETHPDPLSQLHSLNRLYLHELRHRIRCARSIEGLPAAARRALGEARDGALDRAAAYPRALFNLSLAGEDGAAAVRHGTAQADPAEQSLRLVLVHSAWNICLQSAYCARVILNLSAATIERLRGASLHELPQIALGCVLKPCEFGGADWLWHCLLTASEESLRERLSLVVLQPVAETRAAGAALPGSLTA